MRYFLAMPSSTQLPKSSVLDLRNRNKLGEGLGEITIYFDPETPDEFKVLFIRFVHEYLHERGEGVERFRHYVCPHCETPVENRKIAMKKLQEGKKDILCVDCEGRVPLWDTIEEQFASAELVRKVKEMEEEGRRAARIEADRLAMLNHSRAVAEEAGQVFEECDKEGIDAVITLTDSLGHATKERVWLVFDSEGAWYHAFNEGDAWYQFTETGSDAHFRDIRGPIWVILRWRRDLFIWMDLRRVLRRGKAKREGFTALALERLRRELVFRSETAQVTAEPTQTPNATIGIVTALPKEYAAMKALIENGYEHVVPGLGAGRRYWVGEIPSKSNGTHRVALTLAAMGNNVAAIRGTLLLEHFQSLDSILMVGIAGGVPNPEKADEHVRLGDIVVSDKSGVVQYDFDKETEEFAEVRCTPIPAGARLVHAVKLLEAGELGEERPWEAYIEAARKVLRWKKPGQGKDRLAMTEDPETFVEHPKDPKRPGARPRVFAGPIASANKLLKNPVRRDGLRDQFGVKAIEMEGAGIADATWDHQAVYLVVRGICDYCDRHKNDEWQEYAAIVAAAYARALIESMPAGDG